MQLAAGGMLDIDSWKLDKHILLLLFTQAFSC